MTAPGIRPARPGELEQVEALWLEASRRLAGRGLDQWLNSPPNAVCRAQAMPRCRKRSHERSPHT
ncbi:hypothetical protein ACIGXF_34255 [Streptomyces sp. NPDC053086]|uniref:hypothetical protein n=1 Tax=unclassified Streptomyces TaxID=2593676 RepID=UPI0037D4C207